MKKIVTLLLMGISLCLSATTLRTSDRQEECVLNASPPAIAVMVNDINYLAPIDLGSGMVDFNITIVSLEPIWIDLGERSTHYLMDFQCINQHKIETMLKPPLTAKNDWATLFTLRIRNPKIVETHLNPVFRC
jgi:hypothetical protein